MDTFLLAAAIFATGLAAGVYLTFTTLITPGLRDADPRDGLKGFQTIDRRVQPNTPSRDWQPVFWFAIVGSLILGLAALVVGFTDFSAGERVLMIAAVVLAQATFWIPTGFVILPFNNRVRDLDLDQLGEAELAEVRADFDRIWGPWNLVRTAGSAGALALMIAVLA